VKLVSYTAPTPAEALKKAQMECGEDALVVSTKQIKKKGLTTAGLYEVVIVLNDEEGKTPRKSDQKEEKENLLKDDVFLDISKAAQQISKIAKVTDSKISVNKEEENSFKRKKSDMAEKDEIVKVKKEILKLSDKIKIIQNMFWEEKSFQRDGLPIPPEFSEIYKKAYQSGMSKDHLYTIMELTLENMPYRMRNSTETIKRYFQVLLQKIIPIRVELNLPKGAKKIMMFVGPTGVGKTTTIAKLAARYSFVKYRHKTGIITLDTYRIGAVEQLYQYAKMMRLPIEDVVDINDFDKAVNSLSRCDIVLIDTVGSSQYDKNKIGKLKRILDKTNFEIDVNLILSSATKLEDLQDIYNGFSFLNIDTIIFTKLDETKNFGNIFSLVYDVNKPISYFSTGQEVPDDIMEAQAEFLIKSLFEGFKKSKK